MTMGEEFGQHFTYLFARLGAAGETPEAEGRETGRAIWCTGTGVTLRLAANRDQLVRQVAGEAVIEVGHQGRFIGALRLGGEGTEPVRHAVYHSRAWPGEALRPEAGECLVKRVKQTTDLMAVALRTGYVGEQSAERRVNCTKSVSVVILGLGEQGTFFALTLPVLPPDLTAEILVDRGVESVERGGYDGNFSLFRDAFEAVKVSVRIFHEPLEAHEEIPVYLAGQFPQLPGRLGGEVFQRVLRGLHVVTPRLLAELRDCLFNLTVYEAFNVFYFLPFYVIGVGEELVAHLYCLLEVTGAEGVNVFLYALQFIINVILFEIIQLPICLCSIVRNHTAQVPQMLVDVRDCLPVEPVNLICDFIKSISFTFPNLLYHKFHILDHASFFWLTGILTLQLTPQLVKLRGDLGDALLYVLGLSSQLTLLSVKAIFNILQALCFVIIYVPTWHVTHPFVLQITQRLDDVSVQRAHLRFECCFDCFVGCLDFLWFFVKLMVMKVLNCLLDAFKVDSVISSIFTLICTKMLI
ncbi:hypothetical protein BOVATA_044970 [Babesia ovata]|uniref:Uncharacterized protein n=1 Tax=Babesia ovata TaxID=189622 RepID=A0A2H6KJ39_9APIC|nr:uncharacterized protein BOVATA_044970 [Babesia ovata]GBE63004.1 hypothetical protein BOVATA_044970 [Babesia ovata]